MYVLPCYFAELFAYWRTLASAVSSAPNSPVAAAVPFSVSAGVNSVSAATAGALATLATQPFDVLKTKMQVRSETKYRGVLSTIRAVWQVCIVNTTRVEASLRSHLCSKVEWPAFLSVRHCACLGRSSALLLAGLCMKGCSSP